MELRPYQRAAIEAVHDYWNAGGRNPLIDLATGCGKSVVLGQLIREVVEPYNARAIVATHVRELVEQDLRATLRVWPACPAGVNSAGLGRRDLRSQVLFANIQSIHRLNAEQLGPRHLLIIDEAHLVPRDGDGMYLALISKLRQLVPDMSVVGLTATPYRLDAGRLDQGEGRVFDDVVYSYGIGEAVRDGYLSPLVSRDGGAGQIDVRGVQRRGGEFVPGALANAANDDELIRLAVADLVARGESRRGWILFCTSVDHAERVRAEVAKHGISVACVTGETDKGERDRAIRAFKNGELRCLTSVGVLTTGFDAPHVDLIGMLRPTLSTGLYVQMLGRGTRLSPGKENCLVLDYSGNVRRHGPVDAIEIRSGSGGKSEAAVTVETVRAKTCPQCAALVAIRTMECTDCGHVWEAPAKHAEKADDDAPVMAREVERKWIAVDSIITRAHVSGAGNKTLRVDYRCGLTTYSEWITLDADQWLGERAARWWRAMARSDAVPSVDEAASMSLAGHRAIDCVAIRVKRDGKYWRVVDRRRRDGSTVDEKIKINRPIENRDAA